MPLVIKNYGLAVLDIPIWKITFAAFAAGVPFAAGWTALGASSRDIAEILNGKKKLTDALPSENQEILAVLAVIGLVAFVYALTKFGKRFREILREVEEKEA